jgi:hypothetical protein
MEVLQVIAEKNPTQIAVRALQEINSGFKILEQKFDTLAFQEAYNQVVSNMHSLTAVAYMARKSGLSTEVIREELSDAWDIFGKSSFVWHLQRWPRGYPGDFEAINMILDRKESTPLDSIGGMIGNYCLNTTIAQQHREKIAIQSAIVRHYCEQRTNPRIASIACGASRDMEMVKKDIVDANARLLLIDFDQAALDESARRMVDIHDNITYHLTNVRRIPKLFHTSEEFDLIYAGGLFDYLPDGIIINILKHATKSILSGGCFMFTNAANNALYHSYKPFIETMADWQLIDRSKEGMENLLSATGRKNHTLELDPTGLMWIAKAYF